MSDTPEQDDSSSDSDTPTEEQEEDSPAKENPVEEVPEDDTELQEVGITLSKSAICDLPSTAVQSIHIENDTPVEVEDDVFVWRDSTTPSGTKVPTKTKCRKDELPEFTKTATKNKRSGSFDKIKLPPPYQKKSTTKSKVTSGTPKKATTKGTHRKGKGHSKKPSGSKPNSVGDGRQKKSQTKVTMKQSNSEINQRRPSRSSQGKAAGGSQARLAESRTKQASKTKVAQTRSKESQNKKN